MNKKLALILVTINSILIVPCFAQAPIFYGMTRNGGGSLDAGTIISFNPSTNAEDTVHCYGRGSDGALPEGSFVYNAGNRLFYGMLYGGGSAGTGVIISFNPATNAEDTIHSFGWGDDGQYPSGNLVYYPSNGLFYGMTNQGGKFSNGAIISFNPSTNAEDTVYSFRSGGDGNNPYGSLVYCPSNGLFYGMTYLGGNFNKGSIVRFNPSTSAEALVWSFGSGDDGYKPYCDLVYYPSNGLFYGMTNQGGKFSNGAIISFNPSGNAEDTVHSFGSGGDGKYPDGNLVYCPSNGLFYGMTNQGGKYSDGAIISFNPSSNAEDTVHSFGSGGDGKYPSGNLLYYSTNGLFYGTTGSGGINGYGTIITFNPSSNAEDTVHSFGSGDDGRIPGDLVLYAAPMGVKEINDFSCCNVYPNPTNGQFTLTLSNVNAACSLGIYNILGEKVYSEVLQQSQSNNTINLTGQPNGVYFYRVINGNSELLGEGKIVLQK